MHYFEDEAATFIRRQVKIVIVFAGQRTSIGFQRKNFTRKLRCFRFPDGLGYTRLRQHGSNLIASGVW
jgi:hypothetical protein